MTLPVADIALINGEQLVMLLMEPCIMSIAPHQICSRSMRRYYKLERKNSGEQIMSTKTEGAGARACWFVGATYGGTGMIKHPFSSLRYLEEWVSMVGFLAVVSRRFS